MADDFTERYRYLLTGSYDCVDRIVLNAYYSLGRSRGSNCQYLWIRSRDWLIGSRVPLMQRGQLQQEAGRAD